ncbi:hypothetical protein [Devosia rhizoryzae]|uniref:Uncharacterized protein n=1 Tax=Devosia rhizoryzae TaxID=2774137 RepID=A0ABX7C6B2_9HYPH|nr:hypothetical protein [Devosia rhizoryzae]QQR39758.1 hypothetical protein JI748_01705 [Devosia rhizoryzae]
MKFRNLLPFLVALAVGTLLFLPADAFNAGAKTSVVAQLQPALSPADRK